MDQQSIFDIAVYDAQAEVEMEEKQLPVPDWQSQLLQGEKMESVKDYLESKSEEIQEKKQEPAAGEKQQCLPHEIAYYTRDHVAEKRYKYLPQGTYKADYLAKCERRSNYPTLSNTTSISTSLDPKLLRLLSPADRVKYSPEFARSYFGTLQDDVSSVRRRLNDAHDELKWVKSHACAREGGLMTYHDKTKERYECAIYPYLTHQPQISTLPVEHY